MPSAETAVSSGCPPCATWASCWGSPSSTRLRARRRHRQRVGQRHLAGLVDQQRVDRALACPRRRTARRCRRAAARRRRRASHTCALSTFSIIAVVAERRGEGVRRRCRACSPRNRTPCSRATRSISSSRLWIALWLGAVTPTRRPWRDQRHGDPRARSTSCRCRAAPGSAARCGRGRVARSHRLLDREVPSISELPTGTPGDPRQIAAKQRLTAAGNASLPSSTEPRQPAQRRALLVRPLNGPPGISERGTRRPCHFGPSLSTSVPCSASSSRISTPRSLTGSTTSSPAAELELLHAGTASAPAATAVDRAPPGRPARDRRSPRRPRRAAPRPSSSAARSTTTRSASPRGGGRAAARRAARSSGRRSPAAARAAPPSRSSIRLALLLGLLRVRPPLDLGAGRDQLLAQLAAASRAGRAWSARPRGCRARSRRAPPGRRSMQPALVGDDRAARLLHLGLALEPVEVLDLLQRVAVLGDAHALADHPVEVDQRARCAAGRRPRPRGCAWYIASVFSACSS